MPDDRAGLPRAPGGAAPAFLASGGELGALMRAHDWTATPLGSPGTWPQSLRTAVRIMLTSRQPIWIGWGPGLTYLYNDPCRSIIGGKHPWALGRPTAEVWRESWSDIGPLLDAAMGGSEGACVEEQLLITERDGSEEETYHTVCCSPIPGDGPGDDDAEDGSRPGGVFCADTDHTGRVVGERRLALLADLAARTSDPRGVGQAVAGVEAALGGDGRDLPFALLYLVAEGAPKLAACNGVARDHPAADPASWPLAEVLASGETRVVADLAARVPAGRPTNLTAGHRPQAPREAILLPLGGGAGVLVAGLNPFRRLDDGYRGFLSLVASGVAAAIAAGSEGAAPRPGPGGPARDLAARVRTDRDLARVRDEAAGALREVARRRAFLIALGDRLRALDAPEAIMRAAGELLGRHLGAARCGYAEVDAEGSVVDVPGDWTDGRLPSAAGPHRLEDFGAGLSATLRAGRRVAVDEVGRSPLVAPGDLAAYAAMGVAASIDVPVTRRGRLAAILFVNEPVPRAWSAEEADLVVEVAERTFAAVEAARAQAALRESEARFRIMADSAPVMIWTTTPEGSCTYLNSRWYEFTGQTEGEALGLGWLGATHPDDAPGAERAFLEASARAQGFRLEYRLRRADGTYAWAIDAAVPRIGSDGRFLGYVGSVIDISDRKRAEERQLLLIHELNHRVKNTLATVQSLASQSFRLGRVDDAVRQAFEARLLSLSRAHDVLTLERWEGAQIRDITLKALAPFDVGGGRFTVQGPPVRLPPRGALAIAMALHELATNAVKHGSLSAPGGRVDLDWRLLGSSAEAPRRFGLTWAERGGPFVAPPTRRGFGSRLLERGLAAELGGEVEIEFRATGVVCHLLAPLPSEEAP